MKSLLSMRTLRKPMKLLFCMAVATACGSAAGQNFPTKPVRIIIPNTGGTPPDIVTRALLPGMAQALGQPVIVENKPGADQRLGTEFVAKRVPADGYTLGSLAVANLATITVLVKDPGFDPLKDLVPITTLAAGRVYLASSVQPNWKTLGEFIAYAKANSGKLNYGSAAASTRLRIEAVLQDRGVNVVHVPYSSTGALDAAMLSGDIQLMITNDGVVSKRDKVLALAVSGTQRSAKFPEVPTFAESGFQGIPGLEYTLNAPAGVPKPVMDKLYTAVSIALKQPDVVAQINKISLDVINDTPDVALKNLAEQTRVMTNVAQRIGLQPQ